MTAVFCLIHSTRWVTTMKKLYPGSLCVAGMFCLSLVTAASLRADEATPQPDQDGWYSLFNGKDLTGWKVSQDSPETFQVDNGEIVVHGPRAHLYYDGPVENANFKNF